MVGLFARNTQPVAIEGVRHAGKPPQNVQRQIDRVELNVGQRVQQCRAALDRGHGTMLDLGGRHQFRALRPAGQAGGRHEFPLAVQHGGIRDTSHGRHFLWPFARGQRRQRLPAQAVVDVLARRGGHCVAVHGVFNPRWRMPPQTLKKPTVSNPCAVDDFIIHGWIPCA
ncbi:hypothetical protein D3C87_1629140 [compost metagenome]